VIEAKLTNADRREYRILAILDSDGGVNFGVLRVDPIGPHVAYSQQLLMRIRNVGRSFFSNPIENCVRLRR